MKREEAEEAIRELTQREGSMRDELEQLKGQLMDMELLKDAKEAE